MTREQVVTGFKSLSEEDKTWAAQEILEELCGGRGLSFSRMMNVCCSMMKQAFPLVCAKPEGEGASA